MSTAGVNAAQRLYDERVAIAIIHAEQTLGLLRQAAAVNVNGRWDIVGQAGRLFPLTNELLQVAGTLADGAGR